MTSFLKNSKSFIRRQAVQEKTGLCRSSIYGKLNPNSPLYDPTFPSPINLSGTRSVAWIEEEIEQWMDKCIQLSRGG